MLISNHLAGFSLNEADNLRKAMGKKKPEVMQAFADQFVEGAVKNGCPQGAAVEIWDNIVKFGGYGFNKSHSTAYAMITYQTAYMKANHRTAFLAANLSCEMGNSDKVKVLIDDMKRAGIEIRGPDIARSGWHFEPEDDAIRFGFGAIKGTGEKAVAGLLAARQKLVEKGRKLTLHGLCAEADPHATQRLCWEALIKAGAFDASGKDRGGLLGTLDAALAEGARAAEDRRSGQGSLFGGGGPDINGASEDVEDRVDPAHAFTKAERLKTEKEVLGFYFSGHPLEERAGLFSMLSSVRSTEVPDRPGGSEVTLAGLIVGLSENTVKSGNYAGRKMARFRLEDLSGGVQVVVFPRTFDEVREMLVDDTVVVIKGKVEEREEPGLILERIMTVEDALRGFEGGLVVHVEPEDDHLLPQLKSTLQQHKGARPLYLTVRGSDGHVRRVRAGGDLKVSINAELAEEVDALLGRGRVKLARM